MKCLHLVCLVSLIITPIFAANRTDHNSDSWEDLSTLTKTNSGSRSHGDNDSDDSETEAAVTQKSDKHTALLLYLLHIRTHLEGIFNSLNTEQPNFDEVTVALSQYQCVLVAKIPSMLQELQDASAQSNGDNETKDNV